jgi:exodeoxyribonuclease VII large subunit
MERAGERLALVSQRLAPALDRAFADAGRDIARSRDKLSGLDARLQAAPVLRLADLGKRLDALDRTRQTLGYAETLRRGYAVVRGEAGVITTKAGAEAAGALEIEFHDGRFAVGDGKAPSPKTASKTAPKASPKEPGGQGSLF